MPSLESQAERALQVILSDDRPRLHKRQAYPAEFALVVMWTMHRGWNNTTIARTIGINRKAVASQKRIFQRQPGEIFRLPLLLSLNGAAGRKGLWKCEGCDTKISGTETPARHHVASHFVSETSIQLYGLYLKW